MMAEDTDLNIKIIEKKGLEFIAIKISLEFFSKIQNFFFSIKNALIEPDKHL